MLSDSAKICISALTATLVLALTDADAQARKLEEACPACAPLADALRRSADFLSLGAWCEFRREYLQSWSDWGAGAAEEEEPAPVSPLVVQDPPETSPEPPPVLDLSVALLGAEISVESLEVKLETFPEPVPVPELRPICEQHATDVQVEPQPQPDEKQAEPQQIAQEEPAPQPQPEQEESLAAPTEVAQVKHVSDNAPSLAAEQPLPEFVRCKIMLMGDSLMEDLGMYFYKEWRRCTGMQFVLAAKFSTGLTRPDYFNWPEHIRTLIKKHRPNVLIVFMGGNDAMPIKIGRGKSVYVTQNGWGDAYRDKMKEIRDIARQHGCEILWIGLPVFGSKYAKLLETVAFTQEKACAELGIPFVNNYKVLADAAGKFQAFGPNLNGKVVRLRQKDKEHMTRDGNLMLLNNSAPLFEKWLRAYCSAHPESCMSREEAKKCSKPNIICPFSS